MAALLLLCGCEGKPAAVEATRIPPSLAQRFYPPEGWAWGWLQLAGAPALRYGVAAPVRATRAIVLLLPDAGEPAEAWFETANALIERGYAVWTLDWAGQGGSARFAGVSDRLYATSFDPDVGAVSSLIAEVIRPRDVPLVIVGDGLGAQLALRALAARPAGVQGAVLGAPDLAPRPLKLAEPFGTLGADIAGRIGFGRPFVAGEHAWRTPEHRAPGRGGVATAWMQANPDLRVGGASLAWTAAFNRSAVAARDAGVLARITAPVTMLGDGKNGPARGACFAVKTCRWLDSPGGAPHLAADPVREHWLSELAGLVESRAQGRAVATPPAPGRPSPRHD